MNMASTNLTIVLTNLGVQFPLIALCILGLILTLMETQRLPRIAMMVAAGLGFLLLVSIAQSVLQPFVNNMILREMGRGINPQSRMLLFSGIAFLFNVMRAIAIGVIAYAAFVERPVQAFATGVPAPKGYPVGPAAQPWSAAPPPSQNAPRNVP